MNNAAPVKVLIDNDLYDLVPVLMDSLRQDLEVMCEMLRDTDYTAVREKAHSSKGAALTFGFDEYARVLEGIKPAALEKDDERLKEILGRLRDLLEVVTFAPAR